MQAVNYSYARNNLKTLISQACKADEECIITSKNNQNVVLMPLNRYNEIKDDIKKSFQEIKEDDVFSIDEAFDKVLASYED
jgi:antitoxin YefM